MNKSLKYLRNKNFVILFTLLFIFSTQSVSARPMFGSETHVLQQYCGECICTYATTTTYFFWINVGSNIELTEVDCSGAI